MESENAFGFDLPSENNWEIWPCLPSEEGEEIIEPPAFIQTFLQYIFSRAVITSTCCPSVQDNKLFICNF